MIRSYDQLLSSVRKELLMAIDMVKRQTIASFLKSKQATPGVYLIFSGSGEVLYVGRTKKTVRGRIQNHLSPKSSSGLLFYVCRDRGVVSGIRKSHQCVCGRLSDCSLGKHVSKISKEVTAISSELKKTFFVATLKTTGAAYSREHERLLTEVLRPKYGFHAEG